MTFNYITKIQPNRYLPPNSCCVVVVVILIFEIFGEKPVVFECFPISLMSKFSPDCRLFGAIPQKWAVIVSSEHAHY